MGSYADAAPSADGDQAYHTMTNKYLYYTYDEAGNRPIFGGPAFATVCYSYTALGRLKELRRE